MVEARNESDGEGRKVMNVERARARIEGNEMESKAGERKRVATE